MRSGKNGLRFLALLGMMLCLAGPMQACAAGTSEQDVPAQDIHLPLVEEDAVTPTGLKTTWSCVYFGEYPFAEVVDSSWHAVDDYALQGGGHLFGEVKEQRT